MRCDPAIDQPAQKTARPISRVGREPLRLRSLLLFPLMMGDAQLDAVGDHFLKGAVDAPAGLVLG